MGQIVYMDYVTRDKIAQKTSQFLTSFDWDLEILTKPSAVYWPGDDVFKVRTSEIVPTSIIPDHSVISVEIRGFTLLQPGLTINSGDFSITLQDFEDQSILALMIDWVYKCNNPNTRSSYRREDLLMDFNLYRLNSSRKPVFQYIIKGCLPNKLDYSDPMDGTKKEIGKCTFGCKVEYFESKLLNI